MPITFGVLLNLLFTKIYKLKEKSMYGNTNVVRSPNRSSESIMFYLLCAIFITCPVDALIIIKNVPPNIPFGNVPERNQYPSML